LQHQEAAETIMAQNEFDVTSPQILALVNETNCSSTDCEFVALANHLNTQLVTQDKKVLREFPLKAISIKYFLTRQ